MLIRFVVANFLSFNDETEFNTLTGSPRRLKSHIYRSGDVEVLKTAAIYGANGAGKSNLVKAMYFLQQLVKEGKWQYTHQQPFRLNEEAKEKPSTFEVEFIKHNVSYSYGISLSGNKIQEEWLYQTSPNKGDRLVFNRTDDGTRTHIEVSKAYQKSAEDKLRVKLYEEELLADQTPLLKMMAEAKDKFPEIEAAYEWICEDWLIIFPDSKALALTGKLSRSASFHEFMEQNICSFHTGISQIVVDTIDIDQFFGEKDKELVTSIKQGLNKEHHAITLKSHSGREELVAILEDGKPVIKRLFVRHIDEQGQTYDFSIEEESDGTLRLFDLVTVIYEAIKYEKAIIIDEIGRSVHPYLLKRLVQKFSEETNSKGQLIFTTHESHLLDQDIFRQDEIWFVEKKASGESICYPLSDFTIRYDLDVRKGYLNGRFGAIPFLANMDDLNWSKYAKEEANV